MRPAALAVLLAALAGPALAQTDPSAAEILRGLRPRDEGADRGIGPARPRPAVPPPDAAPAASAAPVQPYAPAAQAVPLPAPAAAPAVDLTVRFRTGSAELTPEARQRLDELGKALSDPQLAPYRFRIEGHTDTVGNPAANRALSERRAVAVVDYLSATFGVDRARLEAVGMGEDAPLVRTGPQVPEARNRRVRVVNLGA